PTRKEYPRPPMFVPAPRALVGGDEGHGALPLGRGNEHSKNQKQQGQQEPCGRVQSIPASGRSHSAAYAKQGLAATQIRPIYRAEPMSQSPTRFSESELAYSRN